MPNDEWYRRTTWSEADAAEFNARLKRSRHPWNKAQYIAIQASTLAETGLDANLKAALTLCDRGVAEFSHPAMLAGILTTKANVLADLGAHDEALAAYREAASAQKAYPGIQGLLHLDYGDLAVAVGRVELYSEIESLFDAFGKYDAMFPANGFRHYHLRTRFAEARGAIADAREYAVKALDEASKQTSQFRYHRRLGLLKGAAPEVFDYLNRLAAG